MKSIFILIMLLASVAAHSQSQDDSGKIVLVIDAPTFPKDYPEVDQTQFHKMLLRVVTKLRIYDVTLGEMSTRDKTKSSVHRITTVTSESTDGKVRFAAHLLDQKSQKVLNKIEVDGIERKAFLRISGRILADLFIPVENDQARKNRERREREKAAKAEEEAQEIEKQKKETDFKERILALKSGVDTQIAEVQKDKDLKDAPPGRDEPPKAQPKPSKPGGIELAEEPSIIPEERLKGTPPRVRASHTVEAFFFSMSLLNTGQPESATSPTGFGTPIEIATDASYLGASYIFSRPFDLEEVHTIVARGSFGKQVSSGDQLATYMAADFTYRYNWKKYLIVPFLKLDTENVSYVILPRAGTNEGATPVNNRFVYAGAGIETAPLYRFYVFSASLSSPVMISSDVKLYSGGKLSGSKLEFAAFRKRIFKDMDLRLFYSLVHSEYKTELATQKFSASFLGLNFVYHF